ncbi:protein GAST1-like [Rhododendron vialii]|uniref:protein GAST1-like n=1 Tax=Rhododendron vialii TaxID=182163 RepID=UPI00265DE883|nr:protein GAST1-like [Rhododendron vialii]
MDRKQIALILFSVLMVVSLAEKLQASDLQIEVSQLQGNNQLYGVTQGSLRPQECGGRCAGRCSKTAYKKPCMFFCQKCCAKCLCVPPGTYGNKQVCPCYNNWKTQRGGPKCP